MRRMMKRLRDERGATAVLVGILLVPLTGFLAIALDVGALYAERGQLQNGADAAALAIAQECAEDGQCNAPTTLANQFSDDNANDGAANNYLPEFPNDHTVKITTSTLEASSGDTAINHPFAALIGHDKTTVEATATAEWGSPRASTVVLPLALSLCEFEKAVAGAKGKLLLITYEMPASPGCVHPIPGGFAWLDRVAGGCESFINLEDGTAPSEAGNSYPNACDKTLENLEGKTILVPIHDGFVVQHGVDKAYNLYGFAAFTITGWKLSGSSKFPEVNEDPNASKKDGTECKGSCRGIWGYFVDYVSLDAAGDYDLGGPDLGASVVRLID
jgi:Flp pilus assembly protein TadG